MNLKTPACNSLKVVVRESFLNTNRPGLPSPRVSWSGVAGLRLAFSNSREGLYSGQKSCTPVCLPKSAHWKQRRLLTAAQAELSPGCAIDVNNVWTTFSSPKGPVPVLKGCSLTVPKGELWMLLGPNGCGKSTLLKVLAGLLPHDRGTVQMAGPCSFVFQNPDHQVVLPTAGADVAFGLGGSGLSHKEARAAVQAAMEAVGVADLFERSVLTLSGGQLQRVAIAGALAEESRVLLLDELTTFLDETDQMAVVEAVRRVVGGEKGVTALWVTHRLEELAYADGAIYMEEGRVAITGQVSRVVRYIERLKRTSLT